MHMISFKEVSGRFSNNFKDIYEKCIEYNKKIFHADLGDLKIWGKRV